MADDALISVHLSRTSMGHFEAVNARGGRLPLGDGTSAVFTPVEALLAAAAGCTSIDVDYLTSRLAEPTEFTAKAQAEKLRDEHGNHLGEVAITVTVRFPEGAEGDKARDRLPGAVRRSHDRLCTVSRTIALPTPVRTDTA